MQPTVQHNARNHKPYHTCNEVDGRPDHNRPWSHNVQVWIWERNNSNISSTAACLHTFNCAAEDGSFVLTSSSFRLMLKQCLTFRIGLCYLECNMEMWECWAKETMDRTEIWITKSVNANLTITVCLIYYARYMFRLYDTIKEILMKYLQVAPKAQDAYKYCKF